MDNRQELVNEWLSEIDLSLDKQSLAFSQQLFALIVKKSAKKYDSEISNVMTKFIGRVFNADPGSFCHFIGYLTAGFAKSTGVSKERAFKIVSDIAVAGVSIGRTDGYNYAIKNYGEKCFQFLIEDKGAA